MSFKNGNQHTILQLDFVIHLAVVGIGVAEREHFGACLYDSPGGLLPP